MQKLSKNSSNKYVITLHEDVITALNQLAPRAEAVNLSYLLNLDSFISGTVLEHLSALDAQIKEAEQKQIFKNCENYYKYGTIDAHEIEKIKRGIENEQ